MQITAYPTPNQTAGRSGHPVRGVVVHTTVGSFTGVVSWFGDTASGVSAHYLVGLDGGVGQFVAETDTARHAGRVKEPTAGLVTADSPNLYTVGIEFEDGGDPHGVDRPEAQYDAGARLLADIAGRWGIPLDRDHVVGHREIYAAKTCPGNLDIDRLLAAARAASP